MPDSNVSEQLIRLQNALLEGRIDRDTYEQLKADLLKSIEAGNGSPQQPVEPPPENPFKKKADFPRVIKSVKFRDLTQPHREPAASPPANTSSQVPTTEKPKATGIGGTRAVMTPLPIKDKPPRTKPVADASVESDTPPETSNPIVSRVKQSLGDSHTWKLVGEIAAHCAVVMALRSWAVQRSSLSAALFWGVESAIHGGAGAFVWKTVHDACLDYRQRDDDAVKLGLAQFAWTMLLLIAAAFWVYLGVLYGGLVGTVVGGRFGFLTAVGGEMAGGTIGFFKAIQAYRSSRERMQPSSSGANDLTDDEDDEDDDDFS